ncbi:MAG: hypothetical protein CMN30_23680 [Sandaracinus sp.]|nr:hypothetical protein [Sandaracinus sp.]
MIALVGCTGDDDLVGATTASSALGATRLPEVERGVWELAPAGCEGLLADLDWTFGVAAGAPELVVVSDPFGAPVCADTYSAVDAELRDIGSGAVDQLWQSYVTTLQELEVYSGMNHATAPPTAAVDGNVVEDARTPFMGDPNPQPNRGFDPVELQNEPNPQPNDTGDMGGMGGGGTSSEAFRPNVTEPTDAIAPTTQAAGI